MTAAKAIAFYTAFITLLIMAKGDYSVFVTCPATTCIANGVLCSNCMYFKGGPFNPSIP